MSQYGYHVWQYNLDTHSNIYARIGVFIRKYCTVTIMPAILDVLVHSDILAIMDKPMSRESSGFTVRSLQKSMLCNPEADNSLQNN